MPEPAGFEAGRTSIADTSRKATGSGPIPKLIFNWWVLVFLGNLFIPLLLGWDMTTPRGRVGMGLGILVLCLLGIVACARSVLVGRMLIVGGAVVALSQFLPIPQIIAGSIGMNTGVAVGLVRALPERQNEPEDVSNVAGGLVVTLMSGGLLMAAAIVLGFMARIVTPDRWWGEAIGKDLAKRYDPTLDDLHDFR